MMCFAFISVPTMIVLSVVGLLMAVALVVGVGVIRRWFR